MALAPHISTVTPTKHPKGHDHKPSAKPIKKMLTGWVTSTAPFSTLVHCCMTTMESAMFLFNRRFDNRPYPPFFPEEAEQREGQGGSASSTEVVSVGFELFKVLLPPTDSSPLLLRAA